MNGKMRDLKVCLIVCWFGPFPKYFPIWLQTVKYNEDFEFLIFTDNEKPTDLDIPDNVIFKKLTLSALKGRAEKVLKLKCKIDRPYRICDFRPMFGLIFEHELLNYDFWGYCDLDVIFGNISNFISKQMLSEYDAIFNGGHFTIIKNNERMNLLFKKSGGAFSYSSVVKHSAIFAFDEITGIQQIAQKQGINAIYSIPYVDADVRYSQLRSVMDRSNPNNQCFYWEKGKLFRVKSENKKVSIQQLSYIHLQKRPIKLKSSVKELCLSFWIEPDGLESKEYLGVPKPEDVSAKNPYIGQEKMKKEFYKYTLKKIWQIIKRNPYQIYVRIVQARNGINRNKNSIREEKWQIY